MRPLPLLLLLAGARVEGRQESHLEERQLLNQNEIKQANCSQLLDTFSESSSNFTRCANQYAQPIFMCRNCLDYYMTVIEIYDALQHRSAEGEVSCKDLLTSRDKVEIIKATFAYIAGNDGLWNRASCNSCYTKPVNHTSRLTETTVKFFALFASTQACFSAHPNQSLTQNKSEACTECQGDYKALSNFYREKVFSQFPLLSGICFDVLDAMNATQREWGSGHFRCGRRMGSNFPLLAAIACILLSPVVFYLTARFSQEAAGERTVVQSNHITDLIARARRQYNQYRRPSQPLQLLEEDREDSRGIGESPEEGHGERVGEERRELPPFSEPFTEHGETMEDGSRSVHVESRDDTADLSRSQEEQVKNVVVDG